MILGLNLLKWDLNTGAVISKKCSLIDFIKAVWKFNKINVKSSSNWTACEKCMDCIRVVVFQGILGPSEMTLINVWHL